MVIEVLRQVYRITERGSDGSVKKTAYVRDEWVNLDLVRKRPNNDPDLMYVVKPSDFEGSTIRRVPD